MTSCSTTTGVKSVDDLAIQTAVKIAKPQLEKFFLEELPVGVGTLFPTTTNLPGSAFNPDFNRRRTLDFDKNGRLRLGPGDYIIPVVTYCMKSSGTSPEGYRYLLGEIKGIRADIIRKLNTRATPRFLVEDIQVLSWSIQNGLSYEEMLPKSREIIDKILPESKKDLKNSFLKNLNEKWDKISERSGGLLPPFDELTEELLNELGEAGNTIRDIRRFKQAINDSDDFEDIRQIIILSKGAAAATPWSKISNNVYARFLTEKYFQELGQVQIRILPGHNRKINSEIFEKQTIDLAGWIGDPLSNTIQPLSFSMLYGAAGILLTAELAEEPLLAAAILAAILAADRIDWDSFIEVYNLSKGIKNSGLRDLIDEGSKTLQKAHDELEKPARDKGILDRKIVREIKTKEKNTSRIYVKPGGDKELDEDFDKFTGKITKPDPQKPNTEMKTLPNGSRVIKRPTEGGKEATLEIQPEKGSSNSRLRIKVRYIE